MSDPFCRTQLLAPYTCCRSLLRPFLLGPNLPPGARTLLAFPARRDSGQAWRSPYPFGPNQEKTHKWLLVERGNSQRGMPLAQVCWTRTGCTGSPMGCLLASLHPASLNAANAP